MTELNSWLFEVGVPKGRDAHNALAHFLGGIGCSHLFKSDSPNKAITYVVYRDPNGDTIIAKSCEPIEYDQVEHQRIEVDFNKPVKVAVQLSAKRKIRPPNLKYEEATVKRSKNQIRDMTNSERHQKAVQVIQELGIDPETAQFDLLNGIPLEIHHKRNNLKIMEPTMNLVVTGIVVDTGRFIDAYNYGVGSKRVYGLGCVRLY